MNQMRPVEFRDAKLFAITDSDHTLRYVVAKSMQDALDLAVVEPLAIGVVSEHVAVDQCVLFDTIKNLGMSSERVAYLERVATRQRAINEGVPFEELPAV